MKLKFQHHVHKNTILVHYVCFATSVASSPPLILVQAAAKAKNQI